jgi:hypothetical protein
MERLEFDLLFRWSVGISEVGRTDVKTLSFEHEFDALRRFTIVLNEQNAHPKPL